jgi:hypothetical protein
MGIKEIARTQILDYCGQVCGGGQCGDGPVCSYGIDPNTSLPAVGAMSGAGRSYSGGPQNSGRERNEYGDGVRVMRFASAT